MIISLGLDISFFNGLAVSLYSNAMGLSRKSEILVFLCLGIVAYSLEPEYHYLGRGSKRIKWSAEAEPGINSPSASTRKNDKLLFGKPEEGSVAGNSNSSDSSGRNKKSKKVFFGIYGNR